MKKVALLTSLTPVSAPSFVVFFSFHASCPSLTSFIDAKPTPPIMGNRLRYTGSGRKSRKNTAPISAAQIGSVALRMCVKEMAPAPKEMTPHTWVAARKNAYVLSIA